MAGLSVEPAIDAAIKRLCVDLDAECTNLYDRRTVWEPYTSSLLKKRVILTGTHACGIWQPGEDIHVICVGTNSARIFWPYLSQNLHLAKDAKLPNGHEESKIELSDPAFSKTANRSLCCLSSFVFLSGRDQAACRFFLHYADAPPDFVIDRLGLEQLPLPARPEKLYKPKYGEATRNRQMVNDILHLVTDNRMGPASRKLQRTGLLHTLRCWAKSHGLVGPRLGFLDVNHLLWRAYEACIVDNPPEASTLSEEEQHLLNTAFKYLDENLDPTMQLVCTSPGGQAAHDRRALFKAVSSEANEAIRKAIHRTLETSLDHKTLSEVSKNAFKRFLDEFDYFFKVECECWANMRDTRAEFQNATVSANLNAVVKFFHDDKDSVYRGKISLRIWPVPLKASHDETEQTYAIGIKLNPHYDVMSFEKERDTILHEIWDRVLDYNATQGVITFTIISSDELEGMSPGEIQSMPPFVAPAVEAPPQTGMAGLSLSRQANTFHPTRLAIARLRYDRKHRDIEYEVGYEDRFEEELMWLPLEEWGGKLTEDENWIPDHRVRQLKRSSDGVIVWDRVKKVDLT